MSEVARLLAVRQGPALVVAHRGDWTSAPENSCAAIKAARAFDIVEIDVRVSADNVPVVMHDASCLRTTGQDVIVSQTNAGEIAAIRLLDTSETVPLLTDALASGGDSLFFDLDVKEPPDLPAIADFMATRPERHRCFLKVDVDSVADIEELQGLQSRGDICVIAKHLLRTKDSLPLLEQMKSAKVAAVEVWFPDIDTLREAVHIGPPLTTYTLRDVHCAGLSDDAAMAAPEQVWGVLSDLGLRAIMTDRPADLERFLDQSEAPQRSSAS